MAEDEINEEEVEHEAEDVDVDDLDDDDDGAAPDDDDDVVVDDDDEVENEAPKTRRKSADDDDDDDELLDDDVEEDLDKILKDRLVVADDEEEEEADEPEPKGEGDERLQPKQQNEQLCEFLFPSRQDICSQLPRRRRRLPDLFLSAGLDGVASFNAPGAGDCRCGLCPDRFRSTVGRRLSRNRDQGAPAARIRAVCRKDGR